jgi:hypothetical protein
MILLRQRLILLAVLMTPFHAAAETKRPVVLELFTSQGCSSCPAADALLQELAQDPGVLALSHHVNYWDRLGWKDPFSSAESTKRQQTYAKLLKDNLYTPQIVIDGQMVAIGSDKNAILNSMEFAQVSQPFIPVTIEKQAGDLRITIPAAAANSSVTLPKWAAVWAMQYSPHASTSVLTGENKGRTIENINNVTRITLLGSWQKKEKTYTLPIGNLGADSIAVLVQTGEQGRVAGVALYP